MNKATSLIGLAVLISGLIVPGLGCRKASGPPPPLPIAEVPAQIQKAFTGAAPGPKDIAAQVAEAVRTKDFPAAYTGVQILASLHDASEEQRMVATRSMLSIVEILRDLQAKGDPAATAALQGARASK